MKKFLISFLCILSTLIFSIKPAYASTYSSSVFDLYVYMTEDTFNAFDLDTTCVILLQNDTQCYTIEYKDGGKENYGEFTYYARFWSYVDGGTYDFKFYLDNNLVYSGTVLVDGVTSLKISESDFENQGEVIPPIEEDTSQSTESTESTEDTSTDSTESTEDTSGGGDIFPDGTANLVVLDYIHIDLLIIIVLMFVQFGIKNVTQICKNFGGDK